MNTWYFQDDVPKGKVPIFLFSKGADERDPRSRSADGRH